MTTGSFYFGVSWPSQLSQTHENYYIYILLTLLPLLSAEEATDLFELLDNTLLPSTQCLFTSNRLQLTTLFDWTAAWC